MDDIDKRLELRGGEEVQLKLASRGDLEGIVDFYRRLPEQDRLYLRRDMRKREIVEELMGEIEGGLVTTILALHGDKVVGDSLLNVNPQGWFRHTGEMRLIVDADFRNRGLGTALAREVFILAVKEKLRKLEVCFMETQQNAKHLFEKLGFQEEGVLSGFVVDLKGRVHDLILMGMVL